MFNNIQEERWKIYKALVNFLELEVKRLSDPEKHYDGLSMTSFGMKWKGEQKTMGSVLVDAINDLKVYSSELEKMRVEGTFPKAFAEEVIKMKG